MANLLPHLDPDDRALALVHGLGFVARDTRNHSPRFAVGPLATNELPVDRLAGWYRRFIDTRSSDAAERTLETALLGSEHLGDVEAMMFAAATDHVFMDGGHTIDFTNKAFEAVDHLGTDAAMQVLPTLVRQTASAQRSEEFSEWRHPHNLAALARTTTDQLARGVAGRGAARSTSASRSRWELLADEPQPVADALVAATGAGASDEELGRAIAYAAALRIVRFHVQNDHGDWDTVHHSFTSANALHQALLRNPTPELRRGCVHGALRVYLDRFLNVPAARLPTAEKGSLDALAHCFDVQGMVDEAGNEAWGFLQGGGARSELIAALGHALLVEDAEFHWYQTRRSGRAPGARVAGRLRRERARSSSRSRASSPRTHRRAASCRRSSGSRRASAAAKRSTKTKRLAA